MEKLFKFNEDFIKNYDEDSKDIFLKQMLNIQKNLHNLHSDLLFLPERLTIEKCNKLVCKHYDKKNYVVHIRALKQTLNH